MKRIVLESYGVPEEVARCVDVPDLNPPGSGEVLFDVLAFPINPADVWFCRGRYRLKPPLPATPGAECIGRVVAVGSGVAQVKAGDLVINLQRENWAQQRLVRAEDVIRVPEGLDLRQAAMLRINPPTAHLLLTDVIALQEGDWLIQNAANSAVGRLVIQMARQRGLRTVNVVRRQDLFDELTDLSGNNCLLDGSDMPERVRDATGGASIRLGIDAVAGEATARMGRAIADGGVVCTIGGMSDDEPRIGVAELIFRGVTLTGLMLGRSLAKRSAKEIAVLYAELAEQIRTGALYAPVDAVYPIEDIGQALVHAQSPAHNGKVLVAPNGLDRLAN
jgi:mitochondrial enoyl-[acyl-carrier protein] reductase / trans-2-enoyl-CoA reductase